MDNPEELPSLQALEQKIAEEKAAILPVQERESAEKKSEPKGLQMGAEIIGCVAVGAFLGWKAGEALGSAPIGLIIGVLFGFTSAVVKTYRMGMAADNTPDMNAKQDASTAKADDAKDEH